MCIARSLSLPARPGPKAARAVEPVAPRDAHGTEAEALVQAVVVASEGAAPGRRGGPREPVVVAVVGPVRSALEQLRRRRGRVEAGDQVAPHHGAPSEVGRPASARAASSGSAGSPS